MKFERTWTGNFDNAFHGLRHPLESYAKSDSGYECGLIDWNKKPGDKADLCWDGCGEPSCPGKGDFVLGPVDIDLAQRMIKAGTPNDKFLRQIFVSVDITAPIYWWKEMDTYKVATTANSTSTMHKLASTPITLNCFETDDYEEDLPVTKQDQSSLTEAGKACGFVAHWHMGDMVENLIEYLEDLRCQYNDLMAKSKQDNLTEDERKAIVAEAKLYWKELIRWLPEGWLQTRCWTANYATLRNIIHWRQGHKLTEWAQFIEWCHTLPYADELLFFDN